MFDLGTYYHKRLSFGSKQAEKILANLNRILNHLAKFDSENLDTLTLSEQETQFEVTWTFSSERRIEVSLQLSPKGIIVNDTGQKLQLFNWELKIVKAWKIVQNKLVLIVGEWLGDKNYVFECYDAVSVAEILNQIVDTVYKQTQEKIAQQQAGVTWTSILSSGFSNVSSMLSLSIGNSINLFATRAIENGGVAAGKKTNSGGGVSNSFSQKEPQVENKPVPRPQVENKPVPRANDSERKIVTDTEFSESDTDSEEY